MVISAGAIEAQDFPLFPGPLPPNYTEADFDNWRLLARCPRTVLLLHDFLRAGVHNRLAAALGVPLEGEQKGMVGDYAPHPITAGLSPFFLNAGSWLAAGHDPDIRVLARVNGTDVMGVRERGASKLFFVTDINGVEQMPPNLWDNLVAWGF